MIAVPNLRGAKTVILNFPRTTYAAEQWQTTGVLSRRTVL